MSDADRSTDPCPTPDLIRLVGARVLRVSEPLEVRGLREDFVEAAPEFSLRISGRHIAGSEVGDVDSIASLAAEPPSPLERQIPEADGLVRLLGAREVQIGGADAEAQAARPLPSPDDKGGE